MWHHTHTPWLMWHQRLACVCVYVHRRVQNTFIILLYFIIASSVLCKCYYLYFPYLYMFELSSSFQHFHLLCCIHVVGVRKGELTLHTSYQFRERNMRGGIGEKV